MGGGGCRGFTKNQYRGRRLPKKERLGLFGDIREARQERGGWQF